MLGRVIVSCGEALVDLVPDPVPGGGPMNAAIAAAKLGAPAAFCGPVSTDAHGATIWTHLTDNGVDTRLAPRTDAPTARAIIEHVPQLRFRFEGDGTADTVLESVDLSVLGDGPHVLHGGTLGLFRGQTAHTLADLAEAQGAVGGLVSLDPNIRPQIIDDRGAWQVFHDRWLAVAGIYKGSDEDLEWIFPEQSAEESAAMVLESGVEAVILTKGGDGLVVLTRDGAVEAAAPSIEVVDTVGAGDTIVGTTLASLWMRGVRDRAGLAAMTADDWLPIAERAVAAAAITCSRAGANPPTAAELDAAMAD